MRVCGVCVCVCVCVVRAHAYTHTAAGADVDAQDSCGETALRLAAHNGHARLVKALLCGGADVNLANAAGQAPLDTARDQKQQHVRPPSSASVQAPAVHSRGCECNCIGLP